MLTTLPYSPEAASIFSHGADIPTSAKKLEKKLSLYNKAIASYSAKIQNRLNMDAENLNITSR